MFFRNSFDAMYTTSLSEPILPPVVSTRPPYCVCAVAKNVPQTAQAWILPLAKTGPASAGEKYFRLTSAVGTFAESSALSSRYSPVSPRFTATDRPASSRPWP